MPSAVRIWKRIYSSARRRRRWPSRLVRRQPIPWRCTSRTSSRSRRTWRATPRSRCPLARGSWDCPSGCSCSAPDGAKPNSSRRRVSSNSRTDGHDHARRLGDGGRTRSPHGTEDHDEDVLRVRQRVRLGTQHEHLSRLFGSPGIVAGLERPRSRPRDGHWLCAALDDRVLYLPSEELFLSRHAQGFSDQSVRPAHQLRGLLGLQEGSQVSIQRAQLEEDTGKSTHLGGSGRIHGADRSLVDYNRSGVPLVEIVSGPDIRSSAQARAYATELRAILIATGASDGRMEEGSMRIDANVSVRKANAPFGTRCEIKNLNSLRSLQRAIDHEALRQVEVLEAGGTIRQETRHWDENLGATSTMRVKEEADDYRYFREPDLVDLVP